MNGFIIWWRTAFKSYLLKPDKIYHWLIDVPEFSFWVEYIPPSCCRNEMWTASSKSRGLTGSNKSGPAHLRMRQRWEAWIILLETVLIYLQSQSGVADLALFCPWGFVFGLSALNCFWFLRTSILLFPRRASTKSLSRIWIKAVKKGSHLTQAVFSYTGRREFWRNK